MKRKDQSHNAQKPRIAQHLPLQSCRRHRGKVRLGKAVRHELAFRLQDRPRLVRRKTVKDMLHRCGRLWKTPEISSSPLRNYR
jgi:hypothetical protein